MMKFLGMVANFAVVLVMAFLLAAASVEAIQLIAQTNSPDKRCEQGEIVLSVWGKGWVCIKGPVLSPSGSLPSASISSPLSRQVPAMSSRTATFLARVTRGRRCSALCRSLRRCRPRTLSSSHFENLIWPLPISGRRRARRNRRSSEQCRATCWPMQSSSARTRKVTGSQGTRAQSPPEFNARMALRSR